MNWFFYALLSAVFISVFSVLARVFLKGKGDAVAFVFLIDFLSAFFLIPIVFLEQKYYRLDLNLLVFIIFVTLIYAVTDILFIKARQMEEVSTVSMVVQAGLVWSLFGGAIFFRESLLLNKIAGVCLIAAGNIVALWQGQGIKLSRGLKLLFLATLLFTVSSLIDKYMVGNVFSPALYKTFTFLITSFWIFCFMPNRVKRIKDELKLQKWTVVLTGLSFCLGIFFFIKALQVGEASRVLPVQNISLILSVLAGIFILKEKERLWQKIVGLLVVFIGVLCLTF
ncbi:MAG: GRP family sugar transporter [bacterium]|nr:GRP family sugar transporter [bacterium]